MFEATLQFLNNIVAGNLPDIPDLGSCRLVPLQKKRTVDGVCPIAVGELWLRLAAVCVMEAFPTKDLSLLPLQCGVGGAEGAQCLRHAVTCSDSGHTSTS